ncbi:MAG: leucine-rich repeat domain-containing protein [Oscillospiraceae bacterium]|nr:leucine-rich repeat domain-containing protein [Oscillospiraceae bacterium]
MSDEQPGNNAESKSETVFEITDIERVNSAAPKRTAGKSYNGRYYSVRGKHSSSKGFNIADTVASIKRAIWLASAKVTTLLSRKDKGRGSAEKRRAYRPVRSSLIIAGIATMVLLLIIIASVIKAASDSREYTSYYSLAEEYYYSKDYSTALTYFRKASKVDNNEDVKSRMADCYYADGNYSKALEILRTMDTRNSAVSARIQSIEEERIASEAPESVTIAGKAYPVTTTSLVLDGTGLNNDDVELITKLYSLTDLSIANNSISDITSLSVLGGLSSLNLSNNRITDISALSSLSSLRVLYLDGNPVSDFSPLFSLPELSMLSLKGITINSKQRETLSLSLPKCALHTEASAASEQISLGGKTFNLDAEQLDLSNMGLSDISSLSECKKLRFLNLSGNSISDISPLLDVPNLETLVLSDNNISNINPLMGLSSLKYLYLDGNSLSGITPISDLPALTELYIADNPVSSLSGIEKLNYLETLDISGTGATDEMLRQLYSSYSLKLIIMRNNPDLTGNSVDELDAHLQNCSIMHDDLAYVLDIAGNRYLSTDTDINLSGLGLTDITWIRGFTDPEKVNLSNNKISNLYVLQMVENAGKIRVLDLSRNSINDINAIGYLSAVEELNLSYNRINAINPLKNLTSLKELHIVGTDLTEKQIVELCNALPNCTVHYQE